MTVEMIFGIVEAAGVAISMLMGGGLLTRYVKHSNDLAVTTYILNETKKKLETAITDIAALQTKAVAVDAKIAQFHEHMAKLDLIPRLDEKLKSMESLIGDLNDTIKEIARDRKNL